jgi:hypothetical protein
MQSPKLYSNKHNLPEPLAAVLTADVYSRGQANISVTELINSPRIRMLAKQGKDEDVIDFVWTSLGTAWHRYADWILSQYREDYIVEERYFHKINGWVVSGQADLQTPNADGTYTLWDWKLTTTSKVKKGEVAEWERQLNCYACLVHEVSGRYISKAKVIVVLRDYKRQIYKPLKDQGLQVKVIDVNLWPLEQQRAYMRQRVHLHQEAEANWHIEQSLPKCSYEEQWRGANRYAVIKDKQKRATKIHNSISEATAHASEVGGRVEVRYSIALRCQSNYCGVAYRCDQRQEEKLVQVTIKGDDDDGFGE